MPLPIIPNGYGLDRALAAMFCGAKQGETVSLQAARAQRDGKRWGCLLCALLARLVEADHCAKTLTDDGVPTERAAAYRAGALLIAASVALWASPLAVWRLLRIAFGA